MAQPDDPASGAEKIELTEADVDGAYLEEPLEKHTVNALKRWLLCHGDSVPTSLKKLQLVESSQMRELRVKVVDVHGSYLHRKREHMIASGKEVALLDLPSSPLSGWQEVNKDNFKEMAKEIPCVTPGLLYTYLAEGTGNTHGKGAFRALERGFNHWSSGRLTSVEININNPAFCHVKCKMTPSMKSGVYSIYMLLGREGEFATILSATCQCAAGKSASCTHVSGLLHALSFISESQRSFVNSHVDQQHSGDEDILPVTSYVCQWNAPRRRKESTMPFSEAKFTKHTYGRQNKRTMKPLENFDPRPQEYRGTAVSRLPELLENIRGKGLSISLSLDPLMKFWTDQSPSVSGPRLPSKAELQESVSSLKTSLALPPDRIRDIEQHTRNQSHTSLWFKVRKFRLTASFFGAVSRRRPSTSPNSLVLSILQHKSFESAATEWGKNNEEKAIELYVHIQQECGHSDLYACKSGFVINEEYPFLGASPDAAVYDPSIAKSFGLAEVKCPYSCRNITPTEACSKPYFFCSVCPDTGKPKLKKSHPYYAQVQGQMAITKREWCDFVVYTEKGLSIERIHFDELFWKNILQKLTDFYDNFALGQKLLAHYTF